MFLFFDVLFLSPTNAFSITQTHLAEDGQRTVFEPMHLTILILLVQHINHSTMLPPLLSLIKVCWISKVFVMLIYEVQKMLVYL